MIGLSVMLAVAGVALGPSAAPSAGDPALDRTRKQVQMLDDLYKTVVVFVTEHYVNDDADLPAGTAAIKIFEAMKQKGWHEVRLIDATGEPMEDRNSPHDAFETKAVAQLLAGKPYYEEIVGSDERVLRAATPVPVVLKKCAMCHPHYENAKAGQPIGILSYTLKIE